MTTCDCDKTPSQNEPTAPPTHPVAIGEAAVRQSRFGIVSCAVGIVAVLLMAGSVLLAYLHDRHLLGNQYSEDIGFGILLLGGVLGGLTLSVLGTGFALLGCVEQNRRRSFAVAGLILNLLILVGVGAAIGYGMWVKHASP